MCCALNFFLIFLRVFSKLAHSFVAIELLIFQKWKIPILLLKRARIIWAKNLYSLNKMGSHQKNYFVHSSKSIFILNIYQNHFLFSIYSHLSYFWFLWLFCTMVAFINKIDQNYPLQQARNLFYNINLLMHHLQVITHIHLSCLDLIINTLLSMITVPTSQIQMTYSPV